MSGVRKFVCKTGREKEHARSFAEMVESSIIKTASVCPCHGELFMIDGKLENGIKVRIMESDEGFHVSIGKIPAVPPAPVSYALALLMIRRAMKIKSRELLSVI